MLLAYTAFIISSYFLGAVPFMILIGRARGIDLSREPDLHHAMWYRVGRGWGLLGILLDVLKGIVPPLVGYFLGFPLHISALSGLAALCGQMWPVFRRFDGERGNTTGLGVVIALSFTYALPIILFIALIAAGLGFLVRTVNRWQHSGKDLNERLRFGGSPSLALPLGVIIGFATTPITSALLNQPLEMTLGLAGVVLLILIRRITAGLIADLKKSKNPASVVVNRLLFDRSEI
jgi:hypothetical protein